MQPITVGAYNELITPVFEAQPRQWPDRESKKDMEEAKPAESQQGQGQRRANTSGKPKDPTHELMQDILKT